MTGAGDGAATTRMRRRIAAPRARVYAALVDAEAIAAWRLPQGMRSTVHAFDARVGGAFRISLTYDDPTATGKSGEHTDTYGGRFVELVPGERVVEEMAFETDDPAMRGTMRITVSLADADDGGTWVAVEHAGVPRGVAPEDNEAGWDEALARLAAHCAGRGEGADEGGV